MWVPADIPYSHNLYFGFILEPNKEAPLPVEELIDQPDILKSSRPGYNDEDITSHLTTEDEPHEQDGSIQLNITTEKNSQKFLIAKTDIIINQRAYKITPSFLLMIQYSYDYLRIAGKFKYIGMDTVSKLFELIKVLIIDHNLIIARFTTLFQPN